MLSSQTTSQKTNAEIDYVEVARELAAQFATRAAHYDQQAAIPHENARALMESGYTAMTVPVAHGGGGVSLLTLCRAQEVLAAGCASTAWMVNMHVHGLAILNFVASRDLEWAYNEVVHHRGFLAGGFSEPGVGGNWWYPTTQAQRVPGGYVLNGRKTFFTGFPVANMLFLSAAVKDDRGVSQALGFVVPKKERGIRVEREWDGCGMRATGSHSLVLEEFFVADKYVVGNPGDVPVLFMRNVHWAWCSFASVFVGIAAGALQYTTEVVKKRQLKVLRKSLAHLPGIQFRIADMKVKLAAARANLYAAARKEFRENDDPLAHYIEISAMKTRTCQLSYEVVLQALRVMGGSGYAQACPIQRMYRDVTAGLLMPPSADMALEWVGKHALGIPVLGDPRWGE
ncbi:MAG: acyl-CoA/acyl-ACP dehydrogenase [Proteobacteria bacterium]|nr:acyl-CoA/acyl-ACP dehydrogenase [Pseudomonadota bacterium]